MTWDWKRICAPFADALDRLQVEPTDHVLLVSIGEKKLERWQRLGGEASAWHLAFSEACSTGKRPPSCVVDSLGTPLGLHRVAEKHGDGAAAGLVFEGRVSTGKRYWERADAGPEQRMLVTTRILRLAGLEPGLNEGPGVDTFGRYVYIHGTTRPERFPENLSAGCVTLLDDELIRLYEETPLGAQVWIQVEPLRNAAS